jgi:phosphohistidine phosphatase
MGQRLAAMGLQPGLLLTSTARRARQTAELVRPAWAEAPRLQTDTRLYLASPGDMLAVIAVQDDAVDSLLVVGHNPGLTRLCNSLVPELALLNLPTAGAVSILCDTATWSAIDAAGFSLAFYDYPKSRAAQAI